MKAFAHFFTPLLLVSCLVLGSGCTAMTPFGNREIPTEPVAGGQQFQVIQVSPVGTKQVYTGTITDQLTIQGALEQANAIKQFSNVEVDLFRRVPESGQTLKLACEFQPGKKIIKYEQDYQILPGDRLVVTAEGNSFQKLFSR